MEKCLDMTTPHYSAQILPVPWHFVISRRILSQKHLKQQHCLGSLQEIHCQGHPVTKINVFKYVRIISYGFLYALEASLVNLELPLNLFICLPASEVLNGLFVLSETVSYPDGSGQKFKDME